MYDRKHLLNRYNKKIILLIEMNDIFKQLPHSDLLIPIFEKIEVSTCLDCFEILIFFSILFDISYELHRVDFFHTNRVILTNI